MGVSRIGRARRIEPAALPDPHEGRPPDYASSFAVDVTQRDTRSAEQWARSILEGAPLFLRWFVWIGWKFVLRLRLAPPRVGGTVAGWTVRRTTPDSMMLEVSSSMIMVRKVLRIDADRRLTLTTYVWYERRRGRVLWLAIAPVHHRIEPLLLTIAASRRAED